MRPAPGLSLHSSWAESGRLWEARRKGSISAVHQGAKVRQRRVSRECFVDDCRRKNFSKYCRAIGFGRIETQWTRLEVEHEGRLHWSQSNMHQGGSPDNQIMEVCNIKSTRTCCAGLIRWPEEWNIWPAKRYHTPIVKLKKIVTMLICRPDSSWGPGCEKHLASCRQCGEDLWFWSGKGQLDKSKIWKYDTFCHYPPPYTTGSQCETWYRYILFLRCCA